MPGQGKQLLNATEKAPLQQVRPEDSVHVFVYAGMGNLAGLLRAQVRQVSWFWDSWYIHCFSEASSECSSLDSGGEVHLKYDFQSEKVFICYQDYCDLTQAERFMIRENAFPQLKDSPFLKISDKETFLKIFYDIIDAKEKHSLSCKAQMLRLLQIIISENAPESTSVPSVNPQIAPLVKSYIDSNYAQKISLSVLERQFDYSRFYIEKLFKQEYGISVMSYRNTKRMEAAVAFGTQCAIFR